MRKRMLAGMDALARRGEARPKHFLKLLPALGAGRPDGLFDETVEVQRAPIDPTIERLDVDRVKAFWAERFGVLDEILG